ncbi:MAG: TRAP transporter small permease [Rhodospirillales bacterium]|nr:TRAP transporter small permease [Rhodospirillales bacterium]
MWNFLSTLANWFDRINRALAAIACAMMVLITLAICIEIFTRTFLDLSNPWLVELSEITLLYLTFLAAAWVLGNDKHVSIDLLVGYMGRRLAGSLQFALSWFAAAACFIVCWFGILTVIDQFQAEIREPTIMAPLTYWITAVVPFGLLLLGFQFLRRGLRALLGMPLAVAGKRDGGHA